MSVRVVRLAEEVQWLGALPWLYIAEEDGTGYHTTFRIIAKAVDSDGEPLYVGVGYHNNGYVCRVSGVLCSLDDTDVMSDVEITARFNRNNRRNRPNLWLMIAYILGRQPANPPACIPAAINKFMLLGLIDPSMWYDDMYHILADFEGPEADDLCHELDSRSIPETKMQELTQRALTFLLTCDDLVIIPAA